MWNGDVVKESPGRTYFRPDRQGSTLFDCFRLDGEVYIIADDAVWRRVSETRNARTLAARDGVLWDGLLMKVAVEDGSVRLYNDKFPEYRVFDGEDWLAKPVTTVEKVTKIFSGAGEILRIE